MYPNKIVRKHEITGPRLPFITASRTL